jgi:hypothetical protein
MSTWRWRWQVSSKNQKPPPQKRSRKSFTPCRLVVSNRRFETIYQSSLQRSSSPRRMTALNERSTVLSPPWNINVLYFYGECYLKITQTCNVIHLCWLPEKIITSTTLPWLIIFCIRLQYEVPMIFTSEFTVSGGLYTPHSYVHTFKT